MASRAANAKKESFKQLETNIKNMLNKIDRSLVSDLQDSNETASEQDLMQSGWLISYNQSGIIGTNAKDNRIEESRNKGLK